MASATAYYDYVPITGALLFMGDANSRVEERHRDNRCSSIVQPVASIITIISYACRIPLQSHAGMQGKHQEFCVHLSCLRDPPYAPARPNLCN